MEELLTIRLLGILSSEGVFLKYYYSYEFIYVFGSLTSGLVGLLFCRIILMESDRRYSLEVLLTVYFKGLCGTDFLCIDGSNAMVVFIHILGIQRNSIF